VAATDAEGREPGIEALRSVASTATGGSAKGSPPGAAAKEGDAIPGAEVGEPHGAVAGGLPLASVDRTAGGGCRSGTANRTTTMVFRSTLDSWADSKVHITRSTLVVQHTAQLVGLGGQDISGLS